MKEQKYLLLLKLRHEEECNICGHTHICESQWKAMEGGGKTLEFNTPKEAWNSLYGYFGREELDGLGEKELVDPYGRFQKVKVIEKYPS